MQEQRPKPTKATILWMMLATGITGKSMAELVDAALREDPLELFKDEKGGDA